MLQLVSQTALEAMLRLEYPYWHEAYVTQKSRECVDRLDERLDAPLAAFIANGAQQDIHADGMTLYTILALNRGMKYFDALVLMDGYLKDPVAGKVRIMRRRRG